MSPHELHSILQWVHSLPQDERAWLFAQILEALDGGDLGSQDFMQVTLLPDGSYRIRFPAKDMP